MDHSSSIWNWLYFNVEDILWTRTCTTYPDDSIWKKKKEKKNMTSFAAEQWKQISDSKINLVPFEISLKSLQVRVYMLVCVLYNWMCESLQHTDSTVQRVGWGGTASTSKKQFYSSGDRTACKILFKLINIHESKAVSTVDIFRRGRVSNNVYSEGELTPEGRIDMEVWPGTGRGQQLSHGRENEQEKQGD